jgi:anhydro-N-acetylmuramic acid kinase
MAAKGRLWCRSTIVLWRRGAGLELPVAVVNIGSVANVTWIGGGGDMIAFDTGPGNAMLDDWVAGHSSARIDREGGWRRRGR